ncbi:phage protein [[Clostridium] sordellii]|nr:phage protein [[Clostridium] sordellii] [Paeniclostridium sordellii]
MALKLCAGSLTIPVEVCPNSDLSTTGNKIPFIIGDLKEGIVFWDRALMNIKMSDTAAIGELNAFEEDLTLFRAIEREDVTIKDKAAIVNGYIDTSVVSSEH